MIPESFWQEMDNFEQIGILVSGGIDSSYIALKFMERYSSDKLLFIHNNTGLRLKEAKESLGELRAKNIRIPFLQTNPPKNLKEILVDSFQAIDRALSDKEKGRYNRKVFDCCYYLKKKPTNLIYRLFPNLLIISGITPLEAMRRAYWLKQLRQKGTYLRYKKKFKHWFGYPLRDCTTKASRVQREQIRFRNKVLWEIPNLRRAFSENMRKLD
jgi:3'-phosphoadenosine 5'-phosphosulfate sulfotransferase (PAPS reductase)/FAD synthetase